jgi:hypothetical protein
MPKIVALPDGREAEFPDEMSNDDIAAVLRKQFPAAASEANRPGAVERGARGFLQGLQDPRDALSQILTRAGGAVGIPGSADAARWWDADIKARNEAYKRDVRGGQDDFDFGRFGGNALITAPLSAATPVSGGVLPAMGTSAITSGLTAALQPVTQGDFGTEKAKQVLAGAGAGAVAGGAANLLGRMISPNVAPEVAKLRAEGVTPTPGQILGGLAKSGEDKLTAAPIVGQAIKAGQVRANEQFNAAAINRALKPINEKLPKGVIGHEAIEYADDALGAAYQRALDAIGPTRLDKQLSADLQGVYGKLSVLPKDKADQFARILQVEIGNRAQGGTLTPEAMKAAESNLGRMAREYGRQADFDVRQLGEAIGEAQDALRSMVERQAPKGGADALRAANAGWANFKRVQRAAAAVGAEDGVFNPSQLHNAVKAFDPSKDKVRFAEGKALMQDLSAAGKKVLTSKIPNSGTPERVAALAALNPGTWPYIAAGIPASLMYTRPGQTAMAGLLAGRQGPAAGLLSEGVQSLALPASMALTPALQRFIAE